MLNRQQQDLELSSFQQHPQFSLVETAACSKSVHERRWSAQVIAELETQQTQFAGEQDDLCWYFLTFCCGYGYGYKTHGGDFVWVTNHRLTPKLVAQQLGLTDEERPFRSLSIATPNQTMAACIDIDVNSRYHPANDGEGIEPVKDALAEIGLIEALEFQSSFSTGMHLWYPLPTAIKSLHLANTIEDACRAKNLEIKDGVLELRPNKRNFNSNFKLIRAPLSGEGNALWVGEIGGLEESSVAMLRHFFNSAANYNRLTPLQHPQPIAACSSPIRRSKNESNNKLTFYKNCLSAGFSGPGQTQEISLAALVVARMSEGVDSVRGLRQRLVELVSSAPGFHQYCGHQREIESGTYWSYSTLKKQLQFTPADYEKSWRKLHNEKLATQATQKALQAISCAVADGITYKTLDAATGALRTNYGAPCKSWWRKQRNKKYKQLLQQLIKKGK